MLPEYIFTLVPKIIIDLLGQHTINLFEEMKASEKEDNLGNRILGILKVVG